MLNEEYFSPLEKLGGKSEDYRAAVRKLKADIRKIGNRRGNLNRGYIRRTQKRKKKRSSISSESPEGARFEPGTFRTENLELTTEQNNN